MFTMGTWQRAIRRWFKLFLVLMTSARCNGEFCPIASTQCSQPGAPCVIMRHSDCSSPPEQTKSTEQYPGPVTSFMVTTKYIPNYPNKRSKSRSNVEFKWNIPSNGTHKHLTGFEVRIWPQNRRTPYCFVYDLSNATWDFDSMIHEYSLNCSFLEENQYDVEVTTLPRSQFSRMKETAIIYIGNKARMENACSLTSCWRSDLVIYNRPCDHSMTVTFNTTPEKDTISRYIVSLISQDLLDQDADQTIPQVTGQSSGTAQLSIPRSILRPMQGRVVKLIPKGDKCNGNRCLTTVSEPFVIVDVDPVLDCTFNPPPVIGESSPRKLTDAVLGGIIMGTILLAAGCTALVVILARRSQKRQLDPSIQASDTMTISTTGSNEPLVKDHKRRIPVGRRSKEPAIPRKLVYLLYANDNNCHKNVIGLFAQFLDHVCHCDVIFDMEHQHEIRDSKSSWIRNAMDKCSCILMLNSEGSYHQAIAMQNKSFYPPNDCDSCLGDMFSPAFRILQETDPTDELRVKLILAHFAYTSPQFRLPPTLQNVQDKKSYHLMVDIEPLYCHIHGHSQGTAQLGYTKHINELWYTDTEQGHVLAQAINYTKSYMLANDKWFSELHGGPKKYNECLNGPDIHPGTGTDWYMNGHSANPRVHESRNATTDSVCGEIDSINSYSTNNNVYDTNMYNNNNLQFPVSSYTMKDQNRYSDISQTSSFDKFRTPTQWRHPGVIPPMPDKPEDSLTLNSSAMGDAVDYINDSGYEATNSSIRPPYSDLCAQVDTTDKDAQRYDPGNGSTL